MQTGNHRLHQIGCIHPSVTHLKAVKLFHTEVVQSKEHVLFRLPSSSTSSSFSGSMSSACVIQSKYPFRSSSSCCFSRSFWKSPRALAFSLSLENSLSNSNKAEKKTWLSNSQAFWPRSWHCRITYWHRKWTE